MAKPLKTQWEFDNLFPEKEAPKPKTVSELTGLIKRLLEKEVAQVWVTGEITNLRQQSSGHVYFTLKDAFAQLSCVFFRGDARSVSRQTLQDGKKVILFGEISVYEARGQYQLRVLNVEMQGVGALQAAFEKLKLKLQAEGLFAPERKRALPKFPRKVGVVTSSTGAAIRDVAHVIERRNPGLEIVIAHCRVQGQGAAEEVACAIRLLNHWGPGNGLDLILVTRGGGSLEDLWAFNEEAVARAVFESALPVISAVGHEIDFTICDFAADFRAATPSAAAEIITEAAFASRQFVAEAGGRLVFLARRGLGRARSDLDRARLRLARSHPQRKFREYLQRVDDLQLSLSRAARQQLRHWQTRAAGARQRYERARPAQAVRLRRQKLEMLGRRLQQQFRQKLAERKSRVEALEATLRLLSPNSVLERGYSITLDSRSGKVIREAAEVQPGDVITTRLKSGQIDSVVKLRSGSE